MLAFTIPLDSIGCTENSTGYMTQTTASEHWWTMTSQLKSLPFSRSLSETIRKPPLIKAQTALKDKKLNWRKAIFNMAHKIITPCNVALESWQQNSLSGITLQCDMWLWDDMPWNSPKLLPYWNSTSGFDFDHITAVNMSFCTSLSNFIKIGQPSAEKMLISKMADLSHLGS